MKNHRWFQFGFAALVVSAATPVLFAQQPNPPSGPMAPEKYKNIQVLTNVPADQLELTMRYVSAAVDMECVSCHVQDATTGEFAYEKDDKRNKQTARQMMKMVNAINAGGFGINVACATCHAGHNQPVGLPLAEMMTPDEIARMSAAERGGGRGGPPGGPRAAGRGRGQQPPAPPVDDVLNKYFDAVGGRASLEKLQSLTLSGTLTTRAGRSMPFTIEEKANKYRQVRETKPSATVQAFDGSVGWMQSDNHISTLMGFPLDEALRTSDLGIVLHMKDKYPNLQASGRQIPIDGKDATVVTGREGVTTEQFYFDTASGLLVRRVITTRTPLGSLREQVDYGDYRAAGGVKIPFEIKRTTWNVLDTFKVANAKANSNIDDSKFAKPKG